VAGSTETASVPVAEDPLVAEPQEHTRETLVVAVGEYGLEYVQGDLCEERLVMHC
jgi:hypothetical protein